jgi:hypothetical protein
MRCCSAPARSNREAGRAGRRRPSVDAASDEGEGTEEASSVLTDPQWLWWRCHSSPVAMTAPNAQQSIYVAPRPAVGHERSFALIARSAPGATTDAVRRRPQMVRSPIATCEASSNGGTVTSTRGSPRCANKMVRIRGHDSAWRQTPNGDLVSRLRGAIDLNRHGERSSLAMRIAALFVAAAVTIVVSGCTNTEEKRYDISPIFPLSADKCAKYNGDETGEGPNATCMVTKSECERAAEDWRQAMHEGGVSDAIQFRCD